jgi:H+/Cl- antiporter ClcA
MKLSSIKGYVQIVVGGFYVAACLVLVLLQWGNTAKFSLFGQNQDVKTWVLMLVSAVGGFVALALGKQFYRGIHTVRLNRPLECPTCQDKADHPAA